MYDVLMTRTQDYEVIIIGGGLAGLSLASTFISKNISTLIIDNQPNPNSVKTGDRRTTALMESSVNFFTNLGIWNEKNLIATPLTAMKILQITPPNTISQQIVFHAQDVEKKYLAYNVDNHALRTALCNIINKDKNITHLFNSNAYDMVKNDNGWSLITDTGTYSGILVVGADGRDSFCRKQVNIASNYTDYNQTAIVFNVRHSVDHNNSSTEFMYPEGAFTFVPMGQNESAIVWVETTQNATTYTNNNDALLKAFIKKAQGKFGDLHIISDIQSFPLNKVIAKQPITDNLCLIAEAHHGITPVAAQGLNLSLRDTAVLGELITKTHNAGGNIANQSLLNTYFEKRKTDITSRSIGTEIFHKFSRQSNPISNLIKTAGIGFLNRAPRAKKSLIHLGLSFPNGTPNFMKKDYKI